MLHSNSYENVSQETHYFGKPLDRTRVLCILQTFKIYLGMIKCPNAGSHILHPNNGVFQAIVALGTHPVYLNPSAHSAVKTLA